MKHTIALSLLLTTCVEAQIGVQARAVTDLTVTANNVTRTLPAGSDLLGGFSLVAMSPQGLPPFTTEARSSAVSTLTFNQYEFDLNQSAFGSTGGFGAPGGFGQFGLHQIELIFDHPTARAMDLVIERCVSWNQPAALRTASGSVTLQDGRVIRGVPQASPLRCAGNNLPDVDIVPITIDRHGFRVVLETSGLSTASPNSGIRLFSSWRLTLRQRIGTPCASIGYGTGCGPVLNVAEDRTLGPFAFRATLDDPALPNAAALIAGGSRIMLPLPPSCDLLNDALVAVPWAINAQGRAERLFLASPGQVFALQLQGATLTNELRLSNGFEFACR